MRPSSNKPMWTPSLLSSRVLECNLLPNLNSSSNFPPQSTSLSNLQSKKCTIPVQSKINSSVSAQAHISGQPPSSKAKMSSPQQRPSWQSKPDNQVSSTAFWASMLSPQPSRHPCQSNKSFPSLLPSLLPFPAEPSSKHSDLIPRRLQSRQFRFLLSNKSQFNRLFFSVTLGEAK